MLKSLYPSVAVTFTIQLPVLLTGVGNINGSAETGTEVAGYRFPPPAVSLNLTALIKYF